jgi:hypothetical protein
MKLLINIGRVILASALWASGAFASYIALIFASRPIFGGNTGGRTEAVQMLSVSVVVVILTLVAILLLAKAGRKLEAITVIVSGLLLGGFFLCLIQCFGGFQILLGK